MFDQFPEYYMNILLRDFNTKLKRKNIFKPTTGNERYAQSNESGNGAVNFGPKICHKPNVPGPKTPLHTLQPLNGKTARERGLLPELQGNCPHYIHQHTSVSQTKFTHSTHFIKSNPPSISGKQYLIECLHIPTVDSMQAEYRVR